MPDDTTRLTATELARRIAADAHRSQADRRFRQRQQRANVERVSPDLAAWAVALLRAAAETEAEQS